MEKQQEQAMDWQAIGAALREPFPPEEVEWRPMSGKGGAGQRVQLVAYVDARNVQDRLDAVCGVGGWSFDWTPLHVDAKGEVTAAKGTLTIADLSKSDVGTASNWEATKGCVSDALKRSAVMWGIGRYLYDLPAVSCVLDDKGNVPDAMRVKLCEALRRRAMPRGA